MMILCIVRLYLCRDKCRWRLFGWRRLAGRPVDEAQLNAVPNSGQDVVYSC